MVQRVVLGTQEVLSKHGVIASSLLSNKMRTQTTAAFSVTEVVGDLGKNPLQWSDSLRGE